MHIILFHSYSSLLQSQVLAGESLWHHDRHIVWEFYSPTLDYLHPVKLSKAASRERIEAHWLPEADAWTAPRCGRHM